MKFSLDGALAAQKLIEEVFEQAMRGLRRSIEEGNIRRALYWFPRAAKTLEEIAWIKEEIAKLKADKVQDRPERE